MNESKSNLRSREKGENNENTHMAKVTSHPAHMDGNGSLRKQARKPHASQSLGGFRPAWRWRPSAVGLLGAPVRGAGRP